MRNHIALFSSFVQCLVYAYDRYHTMNNTSFSYILLSLGSYFLSRDRNVLRHNYNRKISRHETTLCYNVHGAGLWERDDTA